MNSMVPYTKQTYMFFLTFVALRCNSSKYRLYTSAFHKIHQKLKIKKKKTIPLVACRWITETSL